MLYDRHSRAAYSLAYRIMGERQAEIDELGTVAGLLALSPQNRNRLRSSDGASWAWWRPRRMTPGGVSIRAHEDEGGPGRPRSRARRGGHVRDRALLLESDPAGRVETPVGGADAIAVSVEPDGGSPHPTTDPMLTAKL